MTGGADIGALVIGAAVTDGIGALEASAGDTVTGGAVAGTEVMVGREIGTAEASTGDALIGEAVTGGAVRGEREIGEGSTGAAETG